MSLSEEQDDGRTMGPPVRTMEDDGATHNLQVGGRWGHPQFACGDDVQEAGRWGHPQFAGGDDVQDDRTMAGRWGHPQFAVATGQTASRSVRLIIITLAWSTSDRPKTSRTDGEQLSMARRNRAEVVVMRSGFITVFSGSCAGPSYAGQCKGPPTFWHPGNVGRPLLAGRACFQARDCPGPCST